jgi:hypothetical protein
MGVTPGGGRGSEYFPPKQGKDTVRDLWVRTKLVELQCRIAGTIPLEPTRRRPTTTRSTRNTGSALHCRSITYPGGERISPWLYIFPIEYFVCDDGGREAEGGLRSSVGDGLASHLDLSLGLLGGGDG